MKKVLASIGIGAATVDTVLPSQTVTPGETVPADVHITGGDVEQDIGAIRLDVETNYRTDDGYREADVAQFVLSDGLTIQPDDERQRTVELEIPYSTPITAGGVDVWVETELDISMALDPDDKDYLEVRPTPRFQAVLDAMDDLGFGLKTAECEADRHGHFVSGQPFVQEFEFRPQRGRYRGDLDELELVAVPGPDALTLYAEVDRRGGLLTEIADVDERLDQTTIEQDSVDHARSQVTSLIERNL